MKRLFCGFFAVLLCISLTLNLTACSPVSSAVQLLYSLAEIGENEQVESKYDYDSGLYYCYSRLNEKGQEVYRTICDLLAYGEYEIYIKGISEEEMKIIYHAVLDDHPEFFWLTGGISWTELLFSDTIILYPEFWDYEKDINECATELETALDEIISQANMYTSLYGKVLFVHDFLTENVKYDDETYELILDDPYTIENYQYSSAYGTLVEHKAICGGYSTAFQLIMQRLGIQCGIATGDDHEWNFLRLEDEYYYMDITWDCPDSDNGETYAKSYEFFCITEDELLSSHEFDEDQLLPECNGKKYDYFIANGYYSEAYDRTTALNIIGHQASNDYIYIKFGSAYETDLAVEDLLSNGEIFKIPALQDESLSYFYSYSNLSLTIYRD